MKTSLDRINLTDKNENLEPETVATDVTAKSPQSSRGLSVRNFVRGPLTCDQACNDHCQRKHVISEPHDGTHGNGGHGDGGYDDGGHDDVDSKITYANILQERSLNCSSTNETVNPMKVTPGDKTEVPPWDTEVSLEDAHPPLGEVLSDYSVGSSKRTAVNPFVKLECGTDACDGHFICKPSARNGVCISTYMCMYNTQTQLHTLYIYNRVYV